MVRISDKRRLLYTEATIMEIQRLSNIGILNLTTHRCQYN